MEMMCRELPVLPETVDTEAREVDVIFTTGARVERYNYRDGRYIEELVVTPEAVDLSRLNNGAAVLNAHYAYDIVDVVASVVPGSARIENGKGVCRIRFVEAGVDPDSDKIWAKVKGGILRNISVGYRVITVEERQEGDQIPVHRVTRWQPMEISLVPIGADDGAVVRSEERERRTTYTATIHRTGDEAMKDKNQPGGEAAAPEANAETRSETVETQAAETAEQRAAALSTAKDEGRDEVRSEIEEILDLAKLGDRSLDDVRSWVKDKKSAKEVRGIIADEAATRGEETASRTANSSLESGGNSTADNMRSMLAKRGIQTQQGA